MILMKCLELVLLRGREGRKEYHLVTEKAIQEGQNLGRFKILIPIAMI